MQTIRYNKYENSFEVLVTCPMCHKDKPLGRKLNEKQFRKLIDFMEHGDGYIQDELRFLDAESREQLLSGICPECFTKLEADYDEDEEEP